MPDLHDLKRLRTRIDSNGKKNVMTRAVALHGEVRDPGGRSAGATESARFGGQSVELVQDFLLNPRIQSQ